MGCAHACAVVRVCVREEVRGARLSSTRMATLKVIKLRRALQPPLTPDTALPIPPTPQNIAIINIPPPKQPDEKWREETKGKQKQWVSQVSKQKRGGATPAALPLAGEWEGRGSL